jgi:hypothetical protein
LAVLHQASHTGFAGSASLFDPSMHYDRIGCLGLEGKVEGPRYTALGGEAEGISSDPSACPAPCSVAPIDPTLHADRQHVLATLLQHAHFDATLKGDPAARRFLEQGAAPENSELSMRAR